MNESHSHPTRHEMASHRALEKVRHGRSRLDGGGVDRDEFLRRQSLGMYKGVPFETYKTVSDAEVAKQRHSIAEQNRINEMIKASNPNWERDLERGHLERIESPARQFFRKLNQGLTDIADAGVNIVPIPFIAKEGYKAFAPPTSKYYKGYGKAMVRDALVGAGLGSYISKGLINLFYKMFHPKITHVEMKKVHFPMSDETNTASDKAKMGFAVDMLKRQLAQKGLNMKGEKIHPTGSGYEGSGIFDLIKEYGSKFLKWLSERHASPSASAPPRSAPAPRTPTLAELGITDRKSLLNWMKRNHPDKGGDKATFQRVLGEAQKSGIKVGQGKPRGLKIYTTE
jgi:hypothetical protein